MPDRAEEDRRIRLRPDGVSWREIEGEIVAVDLESSLYFGVNESGSVLWPLLAEGATRAELVDALEDRFDLESDQARHDVEEFLRALDGHDLLQEEP